MREQSANREVNVFSKLLSMSLIMMMNRIGPRTVPWGTPDVTGDGLDRAPFPETCWVLLVRKVWSQGPIFPSILNYFNLEHRMEWSTLSNALEKSRYTESRSFPDSSTLVIVSVWKSNWERVERPFKKPCWYCRRRLLSSRWVTMAFLRIFSNSLVIWEIRDMGR